MIAPPDFIVKPCCMNWRYTRLLLRGDTGGDRHLQNFLDAVRGDARPNADALTAHLSCALVHLGEVAYRTERVLHFDPKTESIRDDEEANALLTKEYRKPWDVAGLVG